MGTLASYANPTFIAQIVRVVIETIGSAPALVALVVPPALVITTSVDNVVALV
jgi:hypothetical protein